RSPPSLSAAGDPVEGCCGGHHLLLPAGRERPAGLRRLLAAGARAAQLVEVAQVALTAGLAFLNVAFWRLVRRDRRCRHCRGNQRGRGVRGSPEEVQTMYSVVLAAMLTTGEATPAWGWGCRGCYGCWGCGGCYGGCWGCRGCYGCWG